jgi:phasin
MDRKERNMTDPKVTMQVPAQVREYAEKSVDQAEAAFSSFMESASKSITMVPGPMTDIAKQALSVTEQNVKNSFAHARKLMQAKDIQEVMQLQTEFLRSQFGVATGQFTNLVSANDSTKQKPDSI